MSPDVVIVGAGISGCASAYELAQLGLKVEVLEKYHPAAMGSGWTLGGVRQSGRDPSELPLATYSVRKWSSLDEELGAETGYLQHGNLRLARTEEERESISALVESQQALGLNLSLLTSSEEIRSIAPQISEQILAASFCSSDGHADPKAAVTAYQHAAERHGAVFSCGEAVEALNVEKGQLKSISTSGRKIHSEQCLLACGIGITDLVRPLGIRLPIQTALATVVQTRPAEPALKPVIGVADGGVTLRQERDGRYRLSSGVRPKARGLVEVAGHPTALTSIEDVYQVLKASLEVCPALEATPMESFWGGLIDMTPDGLPFLGEAQGAQGVFIAAGFSGHGFGIAPATAHIMSALISERASDIPYEAFAPERFQDKKEEKDEAGAATLHG